MSRSIDEIMSEHTAWSVPTFSEATSISSLTKLCGEIEEVHDAIVNNLTTKAEEYADCVMCLFDSAAREHVTIEAINAALESKLSKNKSRVWAKNADNTYSHVKK